MYYCREPTQGAPGPWGATRPGRLIPVSKEGDGCLSRNRLFTVDFLH